MADSGSEGKHMKTAVFYENLYDGAKAAGKRVDDTLRELMDLGMEMLYLSADSWERDRHELGKILEKLDLPVEGMHGFCDFPGDPDTARYRRIVDCAVEAGAGNLLIIPGMLTGGNTWRDLEIMVSGVRRTVEYGKARGIPVLMEDFDGLLAPYNCIAGLKYFMDEVEGLGCAFDTGNFSAFHEDELEAFDLFADRIVTVHLKDRCPAPRYGGEHPFRCADGQEVCPCAVGSGVIRIEEILRRLKARGYTGNVIAELYACDPAFFFRDAAESLQWLKGKV